jgi:hypothetical protein
VGVSVEIINLAEKRRERTKPLSYFVRVDQYPDDLEGAILDLGDNLSADQLRTVAEDLIKLSRMIRFQADERDDNPDQAMVFEMRCFKSGRARTWYVDDTNTAENRQWVRELLEDVLEDITPEAEKAGAG